jgi:hypothetical protein
MGDATDRGADHDAVVAALPGWLDELGLEASVAGDDRWMTMLSGEWKRTIQVLLHVDERHLRLRSLLCPAVDEHHAEVYALLLHRNERTGAVRFALDGVGDVVLLGAVPHAALDAARFDELLGEVLTTMDETFNAVLAKGFAGYIGREQAWRASVGLEPNPAFPDTGPGSDDG